MRAPFEPEDPRDIRKLARLARDGKVEGDSGFAATPTSIMFLMYRTPGDGHDDYVTNDRWSNGQHQLAMSWSRFLALQGRAPHGWKGPAPLLLQGAFLMTMEWTSEAGFHDDVTSRLAVVLDT